MCFLAWRHFADTTALPGSRSITTAQTTTGWRRTTYLRAASGSLQSHWVYLVTKLCLTLLWPQRLQSARLLCPWDFPHKNIGGGYHSRFQGIFPTHGLNLHLLHWGVFFTTVRNDLSNWSQITHQRREGSLSPFERVQRVPRGEDCSRTSHPPFSVHPLNPGSSKAKTSKMDLKNASQG